MNKFFSFFLILVTLSCSKDSESKLNCYTETYPPSNSHKVTIKQGVWGDVWFWSGDFMPVGSGEICQVKREVYVYELTTFSDAEQIDDTPFFTGINTKLVTVVASDSEGFFQIELKTGNYSLFVKEDGKFYSNSFKSNGIFPVTIELDKDNEVRFDITYKATF